MPTKRMPLMLGRQSLGPQWDAIKEDVVGPDQPTPIDTEEDKPSNFLGEIVANVVDRKKYPGAGPHITRVHDPKGS